MRIKCGVAEWDKPQVIVAGRVINTLNDPFLVGYSYQIMYEVYMSNPDTNPETSRYFLIRLEDSRLFVAKSEQLDHKNG